MSNTLIQEVSPGRLGDVIELRVPLGLFLAKEGPFWVAVDNRDGDAWTEDFREKNQAIHWLLDENDAEYQQKGNQNENW